MAPFLSFLRGTVVQMAAAVRLCRWDVGRGRARKEYNYIEVLPSIIDECQDHVVMLIATAVTAVKDICQVNKIVIYLVRQSISTM